MLGMFLTLHCNFEKEKKSKDLQNSSSPEKTYTHCDAVFRAEGTKIAKALKLMCFKYNKKIKVNI